MSVLQARPKLSKLQELLPRMWLTAEHNKLQLRQKQENSLRQKHAYDASDAYGHSNSQTLFLFFLPFLLFVLCK